MKATKDKRRKVRRAWDTLGATLDQESRLGRRSNPRGLAAEGFSSLLRMPVSPPALCTCGTYGPQPRESWHAGHIRRLRMCIPAAYSPMIMSTLTVRKLSRVRATRLFHYPLQCTISSCKLSKSAAREQRTQAAPKALIPPVGFPVRNVLIDPAMKAAVMLRESGSGSLDAALGSEPDPLSSDPLSSQPPGQQARCLPLIGRSHSRADSRGPLLITHVSPR